MAVTLKTLIEVAPLDDKLRREVLARLETLTDDQKLRLSIACWQALARQFDARYRARVAQALLEIREGKKQYSKEELQKIETDLYHEFAQLLESAETEEEIQEVREKLREYMDKPSSSTGNE